MSISHGFNSPRTDQGRFLIEFGWPATLDTTACLCVPEALRFMVEPAPGGWTEIMAGNHTLALWEAPGWVDPVAARVTLCAL